MNKFFNFVLLLSILINTNPQRQPPPNFSNEEEWDRKPPPPIPDVTVITTAIATEVSEFEGVTEEQEISYAPFATSFPDIWDCSVTFYRDNKVLYTEFLDQTEGQAFNSQFPKSKDNTIDVFTWYGTRCYCWIVIYQDQEFNGSNIAFWVNELNLPQEEAGYFDLKKFSSYDFNQGDWIFWNEVISSYTVYCY